MSKCMSLEQYGISNPSLPYTDSHKSNRQRHTVGQDSCDGEKSKITGYLSKGLGLEKERDGRAP